MGIIKRIKAIAATSGSSKEKILFVRADSKVRVRFLQELDDGYEFTFHDSYADGINTVCREEFGDECPLCGNESLRTRSMFAWSVWNYETKQVEIALFAYNRVSPVSILLNLSDTYGTITDRDYVISRDGKQLDTKYAVIPMDREKFRNEKAKPLSKEAMLKILDKAYPFNELNKDEDDEEDDEPIVRNKTKASGKKSKSKVETDDDDFSDLDEEDYAQVDDDDEELFETKKKKKSSARSKEAKEIKVEDAEEMLEDEDIDEDDFCDYFEVSSVKKAVKGKTVKAFKKMVEEYLESLEEE